MTEFDGRATLSDLEVKLEALLFVAAGPVSILHLAEALDRKQDEVEAAINELAMGYARRGALAVQWHAGQVQLTTAPQMAPLVEKFLGLEATSRLSKASIEALAIIAYRQPITRPGIDAIRGVSSDGVIKSLIGKGLIQEAGRAEGPGRPIIYETTVDFLQHFGLSALTELPPFEFNLEDVQQQKTPNLLKD
jgi:segregation and condensation protein B